VFRSEASERVVEVVPFAAWSGYTLPFARFGVWTVDRSPNTFARVFAGERSTRASFRVSGDETAAFPEERELPMQD